MLLLDLYLCCIRLKAYSISFFVFYYLTQSGTFFMHFTFLLIFTAQCYAMRAWYMLSSCVHLSICPFVCLSQVGVLLRWLNLGLHKQSHTIAQRLWFANAKDLSEIPTGSPPRGAPNRGGVGTDWRFLTSISLYLRNGAR